MDTANEADGNEEVVLRSALWGGWPPIDLLGSSNLIVPLSAALAGCLLLRWRATWDQQEQNVLCLVR